MLRTRMTGYAPFCLLSLSLLISSLLFSPLSQASETDAFTGRYEPLEDATADLNQIVNDHISKALETINQHNLNTHQTQCSFKFLNHIFDQHLRRPLYGKIEGIINSDSFTKKIRFSLKDSIYRDIDFRQGAPIHLGKLGLGSSVKIGDFFIGSDKFGHFFDEGYHYFKLYQDFNSTSDPESLDEQKLYHAMSYGEKTEIGFFGLQTTGVKSFADMAANLHGLRFWSQIYHVDLPSLNDLGPSEPLLDCSLGQWIQLRPFDFSEYIDAAWDEGINCNTYRDSDFENKVLTAIRSLEIKNHHRYQCPILPDACSTLKAKYGHLAPLLITDKCF